VVGTSAPVTKGPLPSERRSGSPTNHPSAPRTTNAPSLRACAGTVVSNGSLPWVSGADSPAGQAPNAPSRRRERVSPPSEARYTTARSSSSSGRRCPSWPSGITSASGWSTSCSQPGTPGASPPPPVPLPPPPVPVAAPVAPASTVAPLPSSTRTSEPHPALADQSTTPSTWHVDRVQPSRDERRALVPRHREGD